MQDNDVVILDAARTAIGMLNGALSKIPATTIGAAVVSDIMQRLAIDPKHIDEVIIGQVLTAGAGQNPARQTSIEAGLPEVVSALTINKVCGSGLKAVQLAYQAIRNGDAELIIAGGQENMSLAPHILRGSRNGVKMGQWVMDDSLLKDGLTDAFHHYSMGITAENIAQQFGISRAEQDSFAVESQYKTVAAMQDGKFIDEIVPISVPVKRGQTERFAQDEYPRPKTTLEQLAQLKPAFKAEGSVTAGNASGVNDGASMLLISSGRMAKKLGLRPLARIKACATAGVDPQIMGTGPVEASRRVLAKSGWQVNDLDLIESNEAFAAQAIYVNRAMEWDPLRVNVNGGAIALGHPIGASGARILVSLLYEMERRQAKKGLATLCIGGGMGIAITLERN
ncbi:acetyl-CoA C-acetyltransferase [Scandinavium goeteborgense]|uniref:acetyl-CoA C-acetyltransferase n=1 Tax=Scandinavium goeteborgense TaxID=1851514 RepID=UPI000F6828ED|nr:acetyl-CoA C-acetyltransferase [Scandinavium goeteborgense]QKN79837.1 acetyl-CoA C-acetyltransferase [Scandinavium goeteborgense]